MKGLRGWQRFYLDLQRRILKEHFPERLNCSTLSLQFQNAEKLNGTLSRNHIFLSFYLKNYYIFFFLNQALNGQLLVATDACVLLIIKELPSSPKECSIRQIMNHFIPNPHPLWLAQRTAWHVACEETGLLKSL